MDRALTHHEAELPAEMDGIYGARETAPDLEGIRTEVERACRETIARGQAAARRADVPAPPAPPFRPGGIRERVAA